METALQVGIKGWVSGNIFCSRLVRIVNRTREVYKERRKGRGLRIADCGLRIVELQMWDVRCGIVDSQRLRFQVSGKQRIEHRVKNLSNKFFSMPYASLNLQSTILDLKLRGGITGVGAGNS